MKSKTTFLLLILVAIIMTACNASGQPSPVTPTSEPETAPVEHANKPVTEVGKADSDPIPVKALRNATYSGIYDVPVTLTDGLFEDDPFTVQYLDGTELYGDLDEDDNKDAVVFLLERGGGTANIIYVAVQLNQDGKPIDAGSVRLDEVSVKSADIKDGQVLLEIITMGPGDGDCCPSYNANRTYTIQDGRLNEIGQVDQDLVKVSADDLNGTSWTLVELNYEQSALAGTEVTISFQDSQIAGTGGCNKFNSGFNLGEDNPFVMAIVPVGATKMACPDPILDQESTYFTALENVSGWRYDFGQLALYYLVDQGELGRLLFIPATEASE